MVDDKVHGCMMEIRDNDGTLELWVSGQLSIKLEMTLEQADKLACTIRQMIVDAKTITSMGEEGTDGRDD